MVVESGTAKDEGSIRLPPRPRLFLNNYYFLGSADNRGATKKSAVKNIAHYKAI